MNDPVSGAGALAAMSDPAPTTTDPVAAPVADPSPTPDAPVGKFYDGVSDEHKGFFENKNYESLDAMAKSYKNLESMRGVPENEMLRIAKSEDAEAMSAMYERLGRPTESAGYEFEGMDEGGEWYKEAAFKAGLNQDQASAIFGDFSSAVAAAEEAQNAKYQESTQAQMVELKNEWGAAYDANMEYAEMAARKFGVTDDQLGALEKSLGTKEMMNFMQKLGSATGEGTFVDGAAPENSLNGVMTPEAAEAKRQELVQDPAWQKRAVSSDPKIRAAAMEERSILSKLAYDQGV